MKVEKIITVFEDLEIEGVTLLSKEEANHLLTPEERIHNGPCWLRTPGNLSDCACYIDSIGYVDNDGLDVDYCYGIVRPALKINIAHADLIIGDKFLFRGNEFKIISPTLAWMCHTDIGKHVFRKNAKANDANNYEASDVKKFVDEWFNDMRTL